MTVPSTGSPAAAGAPYTGVAPAGRRPFDLLLLTDRVAVTAWFFMVAVSAVPFFYNIPLLSALRYVVAGYFTLGIFLYPSKTFPAAARGWIIFVLPVMCVISSIWSPYPTDAIRKGILLGMTGIISIYFAARITPRTIFYGFFAAEFVCMVLSYIYPYESEGGLIGVFNQKNVLAMNMFFLYATGLTLALDSKMGIVWRAIAALSIPLAFVLILLSQSATTIVLAAGCTVGLLVQALVWQPASRVRHVRSFLVLLGAMLLSVLALLVFGILQFNAETGILDLLGKDSTLTGRTYLWEQARQLMKDHPLTGVGADSFWHPERGQADAITKYFYYKEFTKFSFHNSYYENGVQLGYPGFYATIALAAWGLFCTTRTWVQKQDLFNMTFLILVVLVIIRSNTEIDLAMEFGTLILVQTAAIRRNEPTATLMRPAAPVAPAPPDRSR